MKYKKGDKFIVEVEDASGITWYTLKGGFHTCDAVLDSYEHYDESAAYQRGLNDAWETARKIANSPGKGGFPELYSIFGSYSSSAVLNGLKATEAIAKIRAYEEAQEIHAGDEVSSCRGDWVVCKRDGVLAYGLDTEWVKHVEELSKLKKTGRSFPEVAALLEKIKGETDKSD